MESLRTQDMGAERVLAEFMDEAFYAKLHDKNGNSVYFERIKDPNLQKEGIDVIIEVDGKRFLIDEKATLYYFNRMIPTFAFEVNSFQKSYDYPIDGWLINDKLKTEYYMLIWPNVKCIWNKEHKVSEQIALDRLSKKDFTIVEAMLVKKSKILEFLEKNNWEIDRIVKYAERLRNRYQNDSEDYKEPHDATSVIYFTLTNSRAEKPINIVIRKDVLRRLADANYFISSEKYVEIK